MIVITMTMINIDNNNDKNNNDDNDSNKDNDNRNYIKTSVLTISPPTKSTETKIISIMLMKMAKGRPLLILDLCRGIKSHILSEFFQFFLQRQLVGPHQNGCFC